MQLSKANLDLWGDLPIVDYDKLTMDQKKQLDTTLSSADTTSSTILPYKTLANHQLPELPADMIGIIEKIWEDVILFE